MNESRHLALGSLFALLVGLLTANAVPVQGGGNSGDGRILGPMKLLVGAMVLARFQPFDVRAPQSVPTTEVLERVSGMVSAGHLWPVVDRIFSLEDARAAIRHVETEHARGKVVIAVA